MCKRDASERKKGGRLDDGSGTRGSQFQYAMAVPGLRERGDEAREHHTGAQLPRAKGSLKGESQTTETPNRSCANGKRQGLWRRWMCMEAPHPIPKGPKTRPS